MDPHFNRVLEKVNQVTGVDLAVYRSPLLKRRLAARMRALGLIDPAAYLRRLETHPAECDRFIDAVGINVSSFFRNPLVFEIVHKRILPEILERKRRKSSSEIRIWSAGCAGGEEAYSLAILVHMAIKDRSADWTPLIFATDIDKGALESARTAVYPRESFGSTKLGILDKYFTPSGTGFEVRPLIRKMVRFSRHDLTSQAATTPTDSVFGTFDLTFCRNVLIYFSRDTQAGVFDNLYKSVASGGYLILGEAETLDRETGSRMDTVDRDCRLYRRPLR